MLRTVDAQVELLLYIGGPAWPGNYCQIGHPLKGSRVIGGVVNEGTDHS